jgi:hypothetical protein
VSAAESAAARTAAARRARARASAELQRTLAGVVARCEEHLLDVRRGVDDIEREDPTDPAAVAFVRALRAVEVPPLALARPPQLGQAR